MAVLSLTMIISVARFRIDSSVPSSRSARMPEPADLVGGTQPNPLVPLHGASRNERFERAENRQLDGARRANGAVGTDADILCGAQILGVQRDRGSLAFDAGFEPCRQWSDVGR